MQGNVQTQRFRMPVDNFRPFVAWRLAEFGHHEISHVLQSLARRATQQRVESEPELPCDKQIERSGQHREMNQQPQQ